MAEVSVESRASARSPQGEGRGAARPAGREMPASEEAEQHVLACCLLDGSDTISRCLEARVSAESFYWPANQILFQAILELYQKGQPVNMEVLAEELTTRRVLDQIGGFPYLMQVTGKIPTTAHAGYFIEKVREKHLLRELIKTATGAVSRPTVSLAVWRSSSTRWSRTSSGSPRTA